MTLDESLVERFRSAQEANSRERTASEQGNATRGVGGGGGSGGLEGLSERVTRVEFRLEGIDLRLGAIETRMDRLDVRMDRLDARMDKLDARMDGLDARLRSVEQEVRGISTQLNLLTTQIVGKLPSWWQMPAVIGATVATLGAIAVAFRALERAGWL